MDNSTESLINFNFLPDGIYRVRELSTEHKDIHNTTIQMNE